MKNSRPTKKASTTSHALSATSVTRGSSAKTRTKAGHRVWSKVELETLNPLLQRQFVTGTQVMLARVILKKGCVVPLHSHHNEQLSYVIEGALKFFMGKNVVTVHAGEVLTIPPNVPHEVKALRDTVTLDIFHPPRMDWINKTDAYLRK
jgi:quercetin dioxygenase-like cupin family protein